MSLYVILFILISVQSSDSYGFTCIKEMPPTYAFQFPQDFGPHQNYSFEYWWYGGYLHGISPNLPNKTFGFLFGPNKCAVLCQPWAESNIINFVSFTVKEDHVFKYSANMSLLAGNKNYVQPDPFVLSFETYLLQNTLGAGIDHLMLNGELYGTVLNLTFNSMYPDFHFVDHEGKHGTGVHIAQNSLAITGTVFYNNVTYNVQGIGYSDHLWAPFNCLAVSKSPWYWFDLTLSNKIGLMIFWKESQGNNNVSGNAYVLYPTGHAKYYNISNLNIQHQRYWVDKVTGFKYYYQNLITIADMGSITVTTFVKDNVFRIDGHIDETIVYEGNSEVNGTWFGKHIHGYGTTEIKYPY